jgi:S1-C subfamily serine protease
MRFASLICAVIALAMQSPATDWVPIGLALDHTVFRVEAQQGDDSGLCSGSVINVSAGYVLTAGHCVYTGTGASHTVDGRHAEVVRSNTLLDLAVLRTTLPAEATEIALAPKVPPIGTPIAAAGFGFGVTKMLMVFGFISQPLNDGDRAVWLNADILFGCSGGPVVDGKGRLIGVTSFIRHSGPAHIAGAVPVEAVRDFVQGLLPVAVQ